MYLGRFLFSRFLAAGIVCGLLVLGASQASADIIAQYNTGADADRLVASTVESGFASTGLTLTGYAGSDSDLNGTTVDGVAITNGVFVRTTNTAAPDNVSFTLTNNSGLDYNLTAFSYYVQGQAGNGAADGYNISTQAQVGGVDVGTLTSLDIIGNVGQNSTAAGTRADVSAALNQVLTDGSSLVFSVNNTLDFSTAVTGSDGTAEAFEIARLAGFTVEGTAVAAVPEPSSLAVLALAGLGFCGFRRKK